MLGVALLLDEINLGSLEQARGIDQISRSIAQIELVTQNTAAHANQSASAAQQLTAQAGIMREVADRLPVMVEGEDTTNLQHA